jgi:hypothetical protein
VSFDSDVVANTVGNAWASAVIIAWVATFERGVT